MLRIRVKEMGFGSSDLKEQPKGMRRRASGMHLMRGRCLEVLRRKVMGKVT